MKKRRFLGWAAGRVLPLVVLAIICSQSAAQDGPPRDTIPKDLCDQIQRLGSDIELLRTEMGKPPLVKPSMTTEGANPTSLYFQARTLWVKAERLSFYFHNRHVSIPRPDNNAAELGDVRTSLNSVQEVLQGIKTTLNVTESQELPAGTSRLTFDQAFSRLIDLNRQINHLLAAPFSPSDVYQQVTLAMGSASNLLRRDPKLPRTPRRVPLERAKRPSDVYGRLIGCYKLTVAIGNVHGVKLPTIGESALLPDQIEPSDVYDMATLIVSGLRQIEMKLGVHRRRAVYYPGAKIPSHVYQRTGMLEVMLKAVQDMEAGEGNS